MLFELFPHENYHLFWLAPDLVDEPYFFVWNISWRGTLIYYIFRDTNRLKGIAFTASSTFLCITWADLFDYVLTGNSLYGSKWFGFNFISILFYCTYIILQEWKSSYARELH